MQMPVSQKNIKKLERKGNLYNHICCLLLCAGFGRDHPVKGEGNFTALVLSGGGAKARQTYQRFLKDGQNIIITMIHWAHRTLPQYTLITCPPSFTTCKVPIGSWFFAHVVGNTNLCM
jgi:hypothetical protein